MAKAIAYSILQSGLEVISLAVVVPLFYNLTGTLIDVEFLGLKFSIFNTFRWEAIVIIIILIFILKNSISLWIIRGQSNFVSAVSVSLSETLYRQFYKQSWTSYLQNNSAETVRKIKTTPSDFAHYVLHGYINLLTDSCTCALMISVMIVYDYRVVLIVLLLCLPVTVFYFLIRRKIIARIDKSFRELTPQASIILTQGVDSFAEARIYHKENFFINRFMKIRVFASQQLADLKTATTIPSRLFELTAILCLSALIFYAKVIAPGQPNMIVLLGLLLIAMYRIIPSLNRILVTLSQMEAYAYAVSELKSAFDAPKEQTEATGRIPFLHQLQLQNISFQYDNSKWTIQQLNLTINKGDFVVIEGPSGAGKTTLLHILAGLLYPNEGKIIVDDWTLTTAYIQGFQSMVGLVSQAPVILQDTLTGNIAFAEDEKVDYKMLHHVLDLACLSDFIKSLPNGIETSLGENGLNLSGGQRQRVALSRALYRDPEILLLDEVTNQLDEHIKEQVLRNLKTLCLAGKTIILASHDPFVKKNATHVLRMESVV